MQNQCLSGFMAQFLEGLCRDVDGVANRASLCLGYELAGSVTQNPE